MNTRGPRLTPVLLGVLLAAMAWATAQAPNTLLHSLFDTNSALQQQGAMQGWSVAVDGNIAVLGAPESAVRGVTNFLCCSGVVKIYEATTGTLLHTLTNPSPAYADRFGYDVDISGTRVVVGALQDATGAYDGGIAYVYDLASATPTVPAITLTNPSPTSQDYFGNAVAIDGTRVVVGAYWDRTGGYNAGIAYAYDLTSATPAASVITLTNPSPAAAGDHFGYDVDISGTRLVVGALNDNTTGADNAGSAYVYDLASSTPTVPVVTLTNPSPAGHHLFGISVAISGTRVVGGAFRPSTGWNPGSAYVFDLSSATPTVPVVTLTGLNPAAGDWFGRSVAISGTRVAVGAPLDANGASGAGRAYVYELSSATPTAPAAVLINPSPEASDYFGLEVAIHGATAVVSAPGDSTRVIGAGAAYVFGPRPALSIVPAAPGFASISWAPATSSGFVLQQKNSVLSTNWANAPSGAANPVTVAVTNASRIYRLLQP